MKKIMIILALVFSFGMTVAHAEIAQGNDTFSGNKTYYSSYSLNKNEGIRFTKIGSGNKSSYEIGFSAKALLGEKYLKTPIEIKIDEKPMQTIEVRETTFFPTDLSGKNAPVLIFNDAIISQEIINQIKEAKRIALRVYKDKYSPVVVVLPDSVLTEWQQVINTEK